MKRIIMPVGTSIFTNLPKKIKDCFKEDYDYLSGEGGKKPAIPASQFDEEEEKINTIRREVTAKFNADSKKTAAETFSIDKIVAELKEDVQVYLLASDTVLSRLACELVKAWFEKYWKDKKYWKKDESLQFNPKLDVISGLQISDRQAFEREGLVNLVNRFDSICSNDYKNVLLNITGGFKATIPYLTIFAQINEIHLKYVFEETNTVIDIPPVPLTINNTLFDKYQEQFSLLKDKLLNKSENYQFLQEASSCLEIDGDDIDFSSLGRELWKKYKEQFFEFYCPDDVWSEIQTQNDIKRIISDKFHDKKHREKKTETKQEHFVFDDGNNNNRIYYFVDGSNVYIYKTFESEPKAKAYIKEHIDRDKVKKDSKHRLMKKQPV